ncbi:MAG: HAD-IA family hydrolase [Deltaproteobacteria bacterium]|nr:HAD-IA family hydrolase [Deltaproteobacteria bacterium]
MAVIVPQDDCIGSVPQTTLCCLNISYCAGLLFWYMCHMNYTISEDIRGLIFDFDGTIVDSMPIHMLSWKEAFEHYNATFSESFFYRHAGVSLPGVVMNYNREYGTTLDPEGVIAQKDLAHKKYLSRTRVIPEVFNVIEKYFHKIPMAVATGNSRNLTEPLLRQLDLMKFFKGVVYGDDVIHSKPHPECFLTAASIMGVAPSHCEVFEDGDAGLEGARRAGMKATDVRSWILRGD